MVSASDIITYGGVPLAVIGVLPTLYIFFRALITLRDIRRTFAKNHVVAITRPSTLAGLVEIEMPRLSLAPLNRSDPLYFKVNANRSELKGGSWTAVHWREMRVATASYRVQYHDQLQQPAAEVDFDSLIAFMLDRGAVPDAYGWADLREAGMWTPTGTVLLRSPSRSDGQGGEPVLRTTTSEDSDGLLALILYWRPEWDYRNVDDLPPYWMRIKAPVNDKLLGIAQNQIATAEQQEMLSAKQDDESSSQTMTSSTLDEKTLATSKTTSTPRPRDKHESLSAGGLLATHTTIGVQRYSISSIRSHMSHHSRHRHGEHLTSLPASTPSLRMRLSSSGLSTLLTEPTQQPLYAPHLSCPQPIAPFFSTACSALAHQPAEDESGSLLWSHTPPPSIVALSHTPSVPHGILALLDIMPGDVSWRSPDHLAKIATAQEMSNLVDRQRKEAQMSAMMAEMRLPPEQKQHAAIERMKREMTERRYEQERERIEAVRAEELEIQEAISSRRLGVRVVADACRAWLEGEGCVGSDESIAEIVERVLWECVRSEQVANAMGEVLESWKNWMESGGITREGVETLKGKKIEFAYAACLLALVGETATSESGSVGSDMQECLRLWKRVRLG